MKTKTALPEISSLQLGVMKKRALLRAIDLLQEAYAVSSERYGLSRKEFAERIHMSPTQFSRILNGRQNISIETAESMLRAFEARLDMTYTLLDDLQPTASNHTSVGSYKKTGDTLSDEDVRHSTVEVTEESTP